MLVQICRKYPHQMAICKECGDNYGVCQNCYSKFLSDQKEENDAEIRKFSYAHLDKSCSLSLRMPLMHLADTTEITESMSSYTIVCQMLFRKLPPKGQLASILTVAPPPKGRQQKKATVYLTPTGHLVNSEQDLASTTRAHSVSTATDESAIQEEFDKWSNESGDNLSVLAHW